MVSRILSEAMSRFKLFKMSQPHKGRYEVSGGGDYWESGVAMKNRPARRGNRSFYRRDLEKRALFFASAYPSLKMIIRILMNNRIQATQIIIQAIFLATPTRNMNMVKMIKNPRGSIRLFGKIVPGNIDCTTLMIPKPI
jgi:hypothetical protein